MAEKTQRKRVVIGATKATTYDIGKTDGDVPVTGDNIGGIRARANAHGQQETKLPARSAVELQHSDYSTAGFSTYRIAGSVVVVELAQERGKRKKVARTRRQSRIDC